MSLFKKDYSNLTKEELNELEEYEKVDQNGKDTPIKGIRLLTRNSAMKQMKIMLNYPFINNFKSIFPNNHLNTYHLISNKLTYKKKLQDFIQLIDNQDISERDILNFIRSEDAHFIISSA